MPTSVGGMVRILKASSRADIFGVRRDHMAFDSGRNALLRPFSYSRSPGDSVYGMFVLRKCTADSGLWKEVCQGKK
jgi:hypothetical protein